ARRALEKIARNGGARRRERTIRTTIGRRLTIEMLNSAASALWALVRSKAALSPTPVRPRMRNSTQAIATAGPDVQIIAPMCSWVVTPPTIDGTRTVVSEIGVILSPK